MNEISCYFILTPFFENDKVSLLNRKCYDLYITNRNDKLGLYPSFDLGYFICVGSLSAHFMIV